MNAVIFDLDGTLVDSAPDIHAAINRLLAEEGQAALDIDTITSFVGDGLPKLVERVMRHLSMDLGQFDLLVAKALNIYETTPADLSQLYPGVLTALSALKETGVRMGVCTNKPHGPAVKLLAEKGLGRFFDTVIGGDSTPSRKPDPAPLRAAIDDLGALQVLYVGDSEIDAETALSAGVDFALFTLGYRKREVTDIPHRFRFDDFAKLPDIVARGLART